MPTNDKHELVIFEGEREVRRLWYNNEWYYSVIDIIAVLTDSQEPRKYWTALKARAKTEGFEETLDQVVQLKLKAQDGRFRLTDTANRQTVLRLIQSIPSPKAEPIRLWLAQVGEERFEEIENPELAIERVRQTYRAKGYDDAWIEQRVKNDLTRNALTDEWGDRGAKEGVEFAILTDTIHEETFDITIRAHKKYKLIPTKANLRDHMTHLELALTSLSEATAITLHQTRDSQGFTELKRDASEAGGIVSETRQRIEQSSGQPVVSPQNHLDKTKSQQKKRIERQQQPSLFDEFNEGEEGRE
jgi:DNA-damage-inducible protein D